MLFSSKNTKKHIENYEVKRSYEVKPCFMKDFVDRYELTESVYPTPDPRPGQGHAYKLQNSVVRRKDSLLPGRLFETGTIVDENYFEIFNDGVSGIFEFRREKKTLGKALESADISTEELEDILNEEPGSMKHSGLINEIYNEIALKKDIKNHYKLLEVPVKTCEVKILQY